MTETIARRNTKQRQAILEELRSRRNHPTAGDLFHSLRRHLPRISLGTVYRNLEILTETGQVLKLACGQTESRYDGTVTPHTHVCCESCHRVADVELDLPALADLAGTTVDGFTIASHSLLLRGICESCRRSS
jgi:Fur family transcriptional regulator, ferric uptake regulator